MVSKRTHCIQILLQFAVLLKIQITKQTVYGKNYRHMGKILFDLCDAFSHNPKRILCFKNRQYIRIIDGSETGNTIPRRVFNINNSRNGSTHFAKRIINIRFLRLGCDNPVISSKLVNVLLIYFYFTRTILFRYRHIKGLYFQSHNFI